jgi:hypothetical protein
LTDPQLSTALPGNGLSRPVSTRFALVAGGLTALAAAVVFLLHQEPWSLRGDNKLLIYPMTLDAFRQWMGAAVPFWSNAQWGGFPLLADPTAGVFYLLNFVPYLLTPDPHYRAFDLATALHAGILVAGTVKLLGRFGAGTGAACFGALLTLLAPHTLFWTGFLGGFAALAWWPWLMLAADGLARSERLLSPSLVLASLLLAAQQFAGHPELGLYSGSVATAWIVARPSQLSLAARVARAATLGVAGLLLSAPQTLPTALELSQSIRSSGTAQLSLLSVKAGSPLALVDPRSGASTYYGFSAFLGAATLALASWATIRRAHASLFLAAVAVATGLLAIGDATPVYGLLSTLPPFDRFRCPLKFFPITQISSIWLAALGLQQILARATRSRSAPAVALLLAGIALAEYGYVFAHNFPKASLPHQPSEVSVPSDLESFHRLAPLLRRRDHPQDPPPRVLITGPTWSFGGLGVLEGVETIGGGAGRLLRKGYAELVKPGLMSRDRLDLFGVQLVFVRGACRRAARLGLEVLQREPGACVLRNPSWPRRYTLLSSSRSVDSVQEMMELVRRNPAGPVPVLAPAHDLEHHAGPTPPAGSVGVESYRPGTVRLRVHSPHPSLLLVRESWGEGWRATLEGRSLPIHPAAGWFFAVPLPALPAGEHEVHLSYRSPGARLGFACAGLWLALAVVCLLPRRAGVA